MSNLFDVLTGCAKGTFTVDKTRMVVHGIGVIDRDNESYEVRIDSTTSANQLWDVRIQWERERQRLSISACLAIENFNSFDKSRVLERLNIHNGDPTRVTAASLLQREGAVRALVRAAFVVTPAMLTVRAEVPRNMLMHNIAAVVGEAHSLSHEIIECIKASPARTIHSL